MNRRRGELIDRDINAHDLSETEAAELATLQTAVDVLLDVAHPAPKIDLMPVVEALSASNARLRAACEEAVAALERRSEWKNRDIISQLRAALAEGRGDGQ